MTTLVNPPVRRVESMGRPSWTHDDFMRLAPDDQKAELINGDIIIMSPPFDEHERLQVFLVTVLSMFVSRFSLGQMRGSRTPVRVAPDQTYEPDILFVSKHRESIVTRQEVSEAPDLVVEILSGGTVKYDRGDKLTNYAKGGVREIWLVDPYGPSGTQFFQRQGDDLIEVAPVEGVLKSITLSNFTLNTKWLWPDANGNLPNPHDVLRELGAL
jgi:Uma2 family endonuclease